MFKLSFEHQTFTNLSDLERAPKDLPPIVRSAVDFCKDWLQGKETFIQLTSGSTGLPKPIEISRNQMEASAFATGSFFRIQESTKLLCCLSTDFIAGKMMLVRAMVWNCPIRLVVPNSLPLHEIEETPDFVAMVPMQVESSLKDSHSMTLLKQIKNLIIGGAPVSDLLRKALTDHQISAWQTYGMTETVSHIALAKIDENPPHYQSLPGVEIGQDNRGALWVKSQMSGPDLIQTNDLVQMNSKGSFTWLGRVDFVINSGGIKLHPELLEQKASEQVNRLFPEKRFFFFGEKDERLGERLVTVIEDQPNPLLGSKLLETLGLILEKYEVPKDVYFINTFIETSSGKINRLATLDEL